jgi:predicted metal-dependent hydrolase
MEIPYVIQRSRRRRRTITVTLGEKGVRVLAPWRTRTAEITTLMRQRGRWLQQRLQARLALPSQNGEEAWRDGLSLPYLGDTYRLCILHDTTAPRGCRLQGDRLTVNLGRAYASPEAAEGRTRSLVLRWYQKQAEAVVAEHLQKWAALMGVRYRELAFGNARHLWGTCSSRNAIRINWRIVMAPFPALEYLLAHELCHIKHKDHSPRFWALLESVMPDYKNRQHMLRECETGLLRRWR